MYIPVEQILECTGDEEVLVNTEGHQVIYVVYQFVTVCND